MGWWGGCGRLGVWWSLDKHMTCKIERKKTVYGFESPTAFVYLARAKKMKSALPWSRSHWRPRVSLFCTCAPRIAFNYQLHSPSLYFLHFSLLAQGGSKYKSRRSTDVMSFSFHYSYSFGFGWPLNQAKTKNTRRSLIQTYMYAHEYSQIINNGEHTTNNSTATKQKQQDNKTTLTRRVPVQSPIGISKTRVQSPIWSGFLLPASHSLPPRRAPLGRTPRPACLQMVSVPRRRERNVLF